MNVDPYVAALTVGFVVALLTATLLGLARDHIPGWLSSLRGQDGGPAPLGGIALFLAFAIAPFLAAAVSDQASEYFSPKRTEFLGFLGAAGIVFLTGLVDDRNVLRPWQKISGQLLAGVAVYAAGYRMDEIEFPWGLDVNLGIAALPVTLLWVLFFTNAINLIDGKDGLATGVSVFAAAALAAVAANTNHPAVALLFVGLAGAGLGFLPYNLPPASQMLGDSGALLFGFLISTLSIRGATGAQEEVFISVPILALGFPVFDTLLSTARRLLDARDPFSGDRDHIHHRLAAMNLDPRVSLAVLYGLSAAFGAAALATHYLDSLLLEVLTLVFVLLLIGLTLSRLGYLVTMWNSRRVISLRNRFAARN